MAKIKCKKCNDIIESPPGSGRYVSCSCGAIAVDSSYVMKNGNEIARYIGNSEDFIEVKENNND